MDSVKPTRRQVTALLAGAVCAAAAPVTFGRSASEAADPVVATSHGRVRGFTQDGVCTFRGIRYGASTAGPNRFMAPKDPAPWSDVFDATRYGPQCPQPSMGGGSSGLGALASMFGLADAGVESSEDCLRLNIWTPACDKKKRAVMFWIHGGFYAAGSGNGTVTDGTALAGREDVVIVSVTHRLNAYGYLYLGGKGGQSFGETANAGQLDLVHALKWVRKNISRFGGDPANVTVFGESGGGRKIDVLMGMPSARGLFRRAIVESGPANTVSEQAYQIQLADALLANLGISRAEQQKLQQVPVDALMKAHMEILGSELGQVVQPGFLMGGFTPVLDAATIPAHPFRPVASPFAEDVELLIGTNRDEQGLYHMADPELRKGVDQALLEARAQKMLGADSGRVLAAYRANMPSATPAELLRAMDTDRTYWINSVRIAERKAAQRPAVRMYQFNWESPAFEGRLGSHHGLDLPFVFSSLAGAEALIPNTPENHQLAERMGRAWANFAKTGNPNQSGVPEWPNYEPGERKTMMIDTEWSVADDPRSFAREIWSSLAP